MLKEIALPDFGDPSVEPRLNGATCRKRIDRVLGRAAEAGYDVLLVYADREHSANIAYLTGFEPRFEEAMLVLRPEQGIRLKPEVLPFSNIPAYLPPFLLSPNRVMTATKKDRMP